MTTREAPRGRAAREDDATMIAFPEKPMPDLSRAPLLTPWVAFPCAGVCAAAAGYVATTAPAFLPVFREMGIALPAATELVVANPTALPAALVAAAVVLLALGAWRPAASRTIAPAMAHIGAVVAVFVACGSIAANMLAISGLLKMLGDH